MSSLGQLNISLTLENAKFQSALTKSDYEAQKFARHFVLNMDQATQKARQFSQRTTQYLSNIEQAAKNINNVTKWEFRANNLGRIQELATTLFGITDRYIELSNKLKLVSAGETQHAQAMADVYDISLKTAQSTQATSSVYQTFAQNAQQLGLAQSDVAKLTETVAKSVAISGASSATASNALVQFSQSLLMGKLKAQEFNSLITQTPSIVQAIAKGLGITTTELKAMVDKGEMSAEKMIEGLKKAESYVNNQYSKTTTTISGAIQNLSTATEKWVGEIDNATGASSIAASAINGLANNLSTLTPYLFNIGVAWAGIKLGTRTKEIYDTTTATIRKAKATKIAAQSALQQAQSELVFARSSMQSLTAQLQLARTERERTTIRRQMKAQSAKIIALTNAETVATQNLANAKKSANLLSGAMSMLGGPIGLVTMGLTFGATALWEWYQAGENAKQKALEFSQSLDQIKERLPQMTKLELEVSINDTKNSIKVQTDKIKELKREISDLEFSLSQGFDAWGIEKSAKSIAKETEELTAKKRELEIANQNLERTEKSLAEQMKNVPLTEMRQQFIDLYPHIDESQIKLDGLNIAIGNFTIKSPEMVIAANNIANALGGVAGQAMKAAIMVANLSGMGVNIDGNTVLSDKAQKYIDRLDKQTKISQLRRAGKIDEANKLQAELNLEGQEFTGLDYQKAYEAQLANLKESSIKTRGNSKSTKTSEKVSQKQRDIENYQNQVSEMTNRLAGLKTDKEDLVKYGGISQYQEVRKLTEDIALNAEKYKNYGTEGVAKLKELASQIDSAQQQVAIEQFQVDQDKNLKAMQFELDLLGKTRTEKELLQFSNQLDLEAERLKINMTKENIALLDEKIAKIKEEYKLYQKKQEETRSSAMMGIKEGWNNIESDVSNVAANIASITQNTFDGMADSLNSFIMTGKADFRSFAQSVLSDISKMLIKMALFNAIKQGMSFMGYYDGGAVGFAVGGYTGDGGKYTPAGIVHKGEYVITKEATSRLGLDYLNYLNYGRKGFSGGGGVAVPRVPSSSYQPKSAQSNISIKVVNNGEAVDAKVSQKQQGEQTQITIELMRKIARQEANGMIQNNFRAGGVFA